MVPSAEQAAQGAIALIEVEGVSRYGSPSGERLRLIRTLSGKAPAQFVIARVMHPGGFPSGASCHQTFEPGQRGIVVLYPPRPQDLSREGYRISDLCTGLLLGRQAYRLALLRHMVGDTASGERG